MISKTTSPMTSSLELDCGFKIVLGSQSFQSLGLCCNTRILTFILSLSPRIHQLTVVSGQSVCSPPPPDPPPPHRIQLTSPHPSPAAAASGVFWLYSPSSNIMNVTMGPNRKDSYFSSSEHTAINIYTFRRDGGGEDNV